MNRLKTLLKSPKALVMSSLVIAALAVTGLSGWQTVARPKNTIAAAIPGVSSTNPCVHSAPPAKWNHVIVIMFENKSYTDVIGNSAAPYINNLVSKCGTAWSGSSGSSPKQNWHDANFKVDGTVDGSYNSKPSYATLTSGVSPTVHGMKDDNYDTKSPVDNIYKRLIDAGRPVKDYYDGPELKDPSAPYCGASNFSGAYHDAVRYYTNVSSVCGAHDVPLTHFMTDLNSGNLPDYSMILPHNGPNMHSPGTVADGNAWIQNFLPPVLDSAQYKSGDTAIFYTWDENTDIPNVLIAPSINGGTRMPAPTGTAPISHFSELRTIQEMLGISPLLGVTGQAPSMLAYFNGGSNPSNPPTITSVNPTSGPASGGTSVTITGTNFQSDAVVKFGSVTATSTTVNSATSITARTPAQSAGVVNVSVTSSGQTATKTNAFTYTSVPSAPTITSVSPTSGPAAGGTAVTITGTNFRSGATVTFGSAMATNVNVASGTSITAVTPAGTGGQAVGLTVRNSDNTAVTKSNAFTYNTPPGGCTAGSAAPTDRGTVTQTVNVSSSGTYRVWVRMQAGSSTANSMYMRVDNCAPEVVGDASTISASSLTWVDYKDATASSKISYQLTAGNHQIVFSGREDAVRLDRVLLLTDATCVPTGNGGNCINNTPPTVTITSPPNGSTVQNVISLAANAVTGSSSISNVSFKVDGAAAGQDTTSPYSVNWDSRNVGNGNHTIQATATDVNGNSGTDSVTVTVNNILAKVGDLNGDGKVEYADLSILITKWNSNDAAADLNHDGTVEFADLSILITHWG